MKTKRRKILLLCMQVLLPVVPGLWTVLFRPETAALSPRMLVTWMLCLNLLFILIYWRRLGWSRSERLDTALLLVLFCFFPLPGHWLLDGMLDGRLWLQIAFYCMTVSYTHLTLPTRALGESCVGAIPITKNKIPRATQNAQI